MNVCQTSASAYPGRPLPKTYVNIGHTTFGGLVSFYEASRLLPARRLPARPRGTFDPAYLNYTMGKLMIRKLREDWTASRGGKQAWQSFHDEFLKYGGPPIPLVRKAMLGGDTGSLF